MEKEQTFFSCSDLENEDTRIRLDHLHRFAQVGRCVNGVTHDINNRLGAILAYAELLTLEEGLSSEAVRMLNEIINSVDKCSDLVSRITDIARDEKPSSSLIYPNALIDRVLILRAYALQTAQVKVETRFQEDMPSLEVDVPKLQLAFVYLLMNAQEALKTASQKLVRIEVTADEEKTEFAFWDSGEALSEAAREKAFQAFTTSKGIPHFGLGLNAAKRFIEINHGTLTYSPARGFVVTLPRRKA